MKKLSICMVPKAGSLGGPRTFQQNLIERSSRREDVEFHFDLSRKDIDGYLVFGGPRRCFFTLLKARLQGKPVVQRLNGINWLHRKTDCGLRYAIHAEMANLSIAFFRRFICSSIVYQSPFCNGRWDNCYGTLKKPSSIVYNGTDTKRFVPAETMPDLSGEISFLLVEGSFSKGYQVGLDTAKEIALALSGRFPQQIVLRIAGKVTDEDQKRLREGIEASGKNVSVIFEGVVDKDRLIALEQQAAFLFSSDLNAACPNAVIEALSCGLPVIGFDTGALKDVTGEGGIIVPYGRDVWNLEPPVIEPLFDAAEQVIRENASFRTAARARAVSVFDLDRMVEKYAEAFRG